MRNDKCTESQIIGKEPQLHLKHMLLGKWLMYIFHVVNKGRSLLINSKEKG